METPDFRMLLQSINRCDAAYLCDPDQAKARFGALGSVVLGRYSNAGHQAVAHRDQDGWAILTLCGTRVNEGSLREHVVDLFEDVDFTPCDVGGGAMVASGALEGLAEVYHWAEQLFQPNETLRVEGHSLGGQRSHLAPLFIPLSRLDRVIAWEPPKAGNDEFYRAHAGWFERTLTVINGADPWAAWPWTCDTLVHPPGLILWLRQQRWEWATRSSWSGGEILASSDHFISEISRNIQAILDAG
jgi:hypothetical protein